MFECLEVDDSLVLESKDTCWIGFDWKISILHCGVKNNLPSPAWRKKWNFEFQQNFAPESYQKSQLDCWLSKNSINLRVFASIKTLEAKFVFTKVSWRPFPIYGCFVSEYHENINRNNFLPKWLEINDNLVLMPKKPAG